MRLPYWIQQADYSATDHDPVDVTRAIHIVQSHDWRAELQLEQERAAAGWESCPPGIGFVGDGRILHICSTANDSALVHYHADGEVLTNARVVWSDVPECIRRFYANDHQWLAQKMRATSAHPAQDSS